MGSVKKKHSVDLSEINDESTVRAKSEIGNHKIITLGQGLLLLGQ